MFWFALPAALIGPLSGSFNSYVRYAAVLFPCFVVLGGVLATESRKPWLWAGSGVFFLLQALLLVRHVTFHWAG